LKKKKDIFLMIRTTQKEKDNILKSAKLEGFETMSTYIKWLYRKHGGKK